MARTRGSFDFAQNFEVFRAAPLDARQKVQYYTDLVDTAAWQDINGYVWLYNGAIVVVTEDPSAGVYWLKDAGNYTNYSNWIQVGSTAPLDPSILQEIHNYIDASLATRDASITSLYESVNQIDSSITNIFSRLDIVDSSISYLVSWNLSQDASIINLDASLNELFSRSVINVGDASANVYAGLDASGNIQLRTFSGSAGTTVTQVGDEIFIGIDASYSGQSNFGQNVGAGDASIYFQKAGDALQFRTLKAGPNITLDVSGQIVEIGATGGSGGDGVDGGVWITDIAPQSAGNVGDKTFSSDGNVLDSCLTDTTALSVSVLALPGHTNYKPIVTINGNPVSLSADSDKPLWEGTYNMTYNFADASITVVHEDGASWSTLVEADTPAVIQSADFINGYPGTQTELKAGDTYDVRVQTDVSISQVIVDNFGAATGGTYNVSPESNDTTFTITIADRGDVSTLYGLRLRVVKSTGSTSANYLTTTQGSIDGKDVVLLNDLRPIITFGAITYPATQSAIKFSESATVNHTVTNYSTISYTSPGGQLTITSPTTYQAAKNVDYLSGTYNISSNNFSISANRAENNASSSNATVVWIANVAPTLSVSHGSKFRSGGNDGTTAQNHTITITSNQRLQAAPTLVKDTAGTWVNGSFSWTAVATSFTNQLQVHDNMTKGTYNWGAISGTGLSGLTSTSNTGTTQYILSGFVVRTIPVAAFGWQSNINVAVTDYTKLSSSGSGEVLEWTGSAVTMNNRSTLGDTSRPQPRTWSASATGTRPTTINILDESATGSSSQASSFTIQEGI